MNLDLDNAIADAERMEALAAEVRPLKRVNRMNAWAKKARAKLIAELGGHCYHCGSQEALHLDHEGGTRTWVMRKTSQARRISRIRKELADGVSIRLLCQSCNAKDANLRKLGKPGLVSNSLWAVRS